MPIITRTTHTTTRSTTRSTTVPVWVIKLLTCVLCIVVLLLIYLASPSLTSNSHNKFMVIMLTIGALLGWSVGSVLQQIITMRNVEIAINVILTALAVVSAVLCIWWLMDRRSSDYDYKHVLGMTVCFIAQSIICLLMLSWACYGNIVVFTSSS